MVFEPFGLELVMVFEGTEGEYGHSIVSILNKYERKRNMRIRNALEEIFCLRSK